MKSIGDADLMNTGTISPFHKQSATPHQPISVINSPTLQWRAAWGVVLLTSANLHRWRQKTIHFWWLVVAHAGMAAIHIA